MDVTDQDSDAIDGDYREVGTGEAETGDFAGDADTDGETSSILKLWTTSKLRR